MKINNRISASAPPCPVPVIRQLRNDRVRALSCGALAAGVLAAVLLAGCGGSSSGGGTHVDSYVKTAVAYSGCMRSHGVSDFPDPNSQGNIQLQSNVDPSSPQYQRAEKVCGPSPSNVTAAQERQEFSVTLKAASCMRANGVPNMPDPVYERSPLGGGMTIRLSLGDLPNSPGYVRAAKKCKAPSTLTGG